MPSIPMNCVAYPRQLTATQLLYLGTDQVAYLKTCTLEGKQVCRIYSANGCPLEMVDTTEAAHEMAAEHDLHLVTVH